MEKKTSLANRLFGGYLFVCYIMTRVIDFQHGFSGLSLLFVLAYLVIAVCIFIKRRDILIPVAFSVLALLELLSIGGSVTAIIVNLLGFLADVGLAILCFGEFTEVLKEIYKPKIKKYWYMPTIFVALEQLIMILFSLTKGYSSNIMVSVVIIMMYHFIGEWTVYPEGKQKKAFRVISSETISGDVATDEDNIISSLYECYCENVKKGLKAPATAVFCKPEELQIKEREGIYFVSGWVDSQNSYGAMIRTPFTLKMKKENGKIVSVTNIGMLGTKNFAANYFTYLLLGIVITAVLFGISYLFVNGRF